MVGNIMHPFSEKWDSLLNLLMDKGKLVCSGNPVATFELPVKVEKKGWFKSSISVEKAIYQVWVNESCKETHFGTLWKVNDDYNLNIFKASQETMDRLDEMLYADRNHRFYELPEVAE